MTRSWYLVTLILIVALVLPAVALSMNSMSIVSTGNSYSSTSVGSTTAYGTQQSSVTSVGSAVPASYQPPADPVPGMQGEPIPAVWTFDQRTGVYYDMNSKSTWVYDQYLNKYYSPSHGWFLINLYYTDPRGTALVAQYYYDITQGLILDITTGVIVNADKLSGNAMTAPQSGQTQGGWTVTENPQTNAGTYTPATTQNTGSSSGSQQAPQSGQSPGGWTVTENPQKNTAASTPAQTGTVQAAAGNPQPELNPEDKPWNPSYPQLPEEPEGPKTDEPTELTPEDEPWEASYYMLGTDGESACGDLEQNTERPGNDISTMTLLSPDPCECARMCQEEESCVAFTYVAPGYEGNPDAQCFLKNATGSPSPNEYCISGLVSR